MAYTVTILILIFLEAYIMNPIIIQERRTFRYNPYHYLIPLVFNAGIGFVLGLEHFINEIRKAGVWKINLPKVIFMVIPSLYFSLSIFMSFISNQSILKIIFYPINLLIIKGSTSFIVIFQLILGYLIITCFYKEHKKD